MFPRLFKSFSYVWSNFTMFKYLHIFYLIPDEHPVASSNHY